jgi:D-arabinose 1-dehydrogenase-like Zn-dependent alcohol dehydrogenase
MPDDLPFEQACFIRDAVSTPWAAIVNTARIRPTESAGMWGVGGLGPHGCSCSGWRARHRSSPSIHTPRHGPLADAAKAVHALETKEGNQIRIILKP